MTAVGETSTRRLILVFIRLSAGHLARHVMRCDLAQPISFFEMMEMPAASFIGMANNHSVHHRGQLAADLRAMGSKVPAIYGGSADEPMQGA